ncbi:MBOAT family O-acyltransferase [Danxiaibacter flavus]|uniref:MBOAT family O-acyltransferase n=1 Tax=Danxiaibacter flavus TaxID=3049108 RepID=A0ABV3ZCA7_9BACT|nr:MBOAT family O-acyltransferase [Chitinophagaceae bacterium DXS]
MKNLKLQNIFILISSFFFYAYWDVRFLFLLILTTVLDYFFALRIHSEQSQQKRKMLLVTIICINLGFLAFFKYTNFFLNSFNDFFTASGIPLQIHLLNIILPAGISFYTFHSLSYTIDVYHRKVEPTRNYVAYASFVAFFPQLVAGPISRARDMLPKLLTQRYIDKDRMIMGMSQIVVGFFKKVAIADTLAVMVDFTYSNLYVVSPFQILFSLFLYSVQIYCDFSGYTDIALGLGKIFGIELKINFNRPYFAKNFSDFWERWHISLSSWLRDYLYIPMGGNRKGKFRMNQNLMVTMLLGGLWHGASYNFIIWGGLHGLFLILQRYIKIRVPNIIAILVTFTLTTLTWVFFRSHSLADSMYILKSIFHVHNFAVADTFLSVKALYLAFVLFIFDLFFYRYFEKKGKYTTLLIDLILVLHIILFGTFTGGGFIYFQF